MTSPFLTFRRSLVSEGHISFLASEVVSVKESAWWPTSTVRMRDGSTLKVASPAWVINRDIQRALESAQKGTQ